MSGTLSDVRSGGATREMVRHYREQVDRIRMKSSIAVPCASGFNASKLLKLLLPLAPRLGIDPDAPSVQRLAPDSRELRALNAGDGSSGYGALPRGVQYTSVVGASATTNAPAPNTCGYQELKTAFDLYVKEIQAAGSSLYTSDPSTLGMSPRLFSLRSDWVVPVPSQTIKMTRVGWDVPSENVLIDEVSKDGEGVNHSSVTSMRELRELIELPVVVVTTGTVGRVLFVVDLSGSMNEKSKLASAKSALQGALQAMPPASAAAILGFGWNCEVRDVVPFSTDRNALSGAIDSLVAAGNTPLLEAMQRAAEIVRQLPDPENLTTVVLTDGEATCGRKSMDPVQVARELGLALKIIPGYR